jgi:cytochrome c
MNRMRKSNRAGLALQAAIGLIFSGAVTAAAALPACVEPPDSQFKTTTLVAPGAGLVASSGGPVQMGIAPDGRVFIAHMSSGDVMVYVPGKGLSKAGNIPTHFEVEDGLLGLALAPDFETSHWLYALATDAAGGGVTLARYTVTADSKIGNRKELLKYPRTLNPRHGAGGLAIDANGILVMGVGDNTLHTSNGGYSPSIEAQPTNDAQRTASNTNDLRGKILRIKPIAFADDQTPAIGAGGTYDIPPGNLWEKIADKSFNPGWDATDKISLVRHEIFTMGHRNPYHPRVDTRTGWVFWGEVGPDARAGDAAKGPGGHDEWNLATGPGFFGHPYCNGYNVAWGIPPNFTAKYSCTAPVNNSPNNTGVHHLPPAVPALVAYGTNDAKDEDPRFNSGTSFTTIKYQRATAVGGPMYRYNPTLKTQGRLPPFFEGKVIFFDWTRHTWRWITLTNSGAIPAGAAGVKNFAPPGLPDGSYVDAQFGPDGALYLLKYSDNGYSAGGGPALFRVEYTGTYDDACYAPFGPGATALKEIGSRRTAVAPVNGVFTLPAGYRAVEFFDVSGRRAWSWRRAGTSGDVTVQLPARMALGLWQARVTP